MTQWKNYLELMVEPVCSIKFLKLLPKRPSSHADNGVRMGIEIRCFATQRLDSNRVLADVAGFSFEVYWCR